MLAAKEAQPAEPISAPESHASAVSPQHRKRLGEVLVDQELLTQAQLDDALAKQAGSGKRLGEFLVDTEVLDERDLATALAHQFSLEVVDLRREVPADDAVESLPEENAREWLAIPLRRTEFGYDVAVADPSEPALAEKLRDALRQPAKLYVGGVSDVRRAIDVAYKATSRVGEHVRVFEARALARRAEQQVEETVGQTVDENAPVVQVVNLILSQAVMERASDVHIEPMDDRLRVRNRTDGALHEVLSLPGRHGPRAGQPHQGHGRHEHRRAPPPAGRPDRGRWSTASTSTCAWRRPPTVHGEKCVLRILDKTAGALPSCSELGMPAETTLGTTSSSISSPYGMVICAGPTGSGKTTTLYATLSQINSDEINVDDDRGPGRVRVPDDQPDPDQRAGRRHVRRADCGRSCARTPTRSSSARSVTSRPRASPCRPR